MPNTSLTSQNAILASRSDVAARIAQKTLERRGLEYADEVRRLLDAALEVCRRCGTTSKPRVADIVAEAGLSNEAFYRHFKSKDALVGALLDDGTERLRTYLLHQMAKEPTPEGQVRRWVEGVLSQAHGDVAETTLAVLYNAGGVASGPATGRHHSNAQLASLLHEPFSELGNLAPELDASFTAHAVLGHLADHLWRRSQPTPAEVRRLVDHCVTVGSSSYPKGRKL